MSGETEKQVSGWTTDTLHEWTIDQMTGMRRWIEEKFNSAQELRRLIEEKNAQRDDYQDKAVATSQANADKAVLTASIANEKRLDNVNEFRASINDVIDKMYPREEGQQRIIALEKDMSLIKETLSRQQARSSGQMSGLELLKTLLPILIAAAALYYASRK